MKKSLFFSILLMGDMRMFDILSSPERIEETTRTHTKKKKTDGHHPHNKNRNILYMTSIRQLLEEKRRKRITPLKKKVKGRTVLFLFFWLTDVCVLWVRILSALLWKIDPLWHFFSFFFFFVCSIEIFHLQTCVCVCPDVLNKSRRHHTTIVGYRNLSTFFF